MSRRIVFRTAGSLRNTLDRNVSVTNNLPSSSTRESVSTTLSKPTVSRFSLRLQHLPQGLCSKKIVRKGLNINFQQTRCMSTNTEDDVTPTIPTASNDNSDAANDVSPDQRVYVRNKKLASIIREGFAELNQSSLAIQNNPITKKGIYQPKMNEDDSNPKRDAEEYRIYTVAQECLEDMCTKDPYCPLVGTDGEPIVLVGVQVKPSFSFADIFWTLPYSVLSAPELREQDIEYLHEVMEHRLEGPVGSDFKRRIGAKLSHYYAPKIRFKVAPPALRQLMMKEME